ncbi:MAG: hypothetical protein ACK496_10345, partial [Acidobacteriota bacterium]
MMSDNSQNPLDADETVQPEVEDRELPDQPDDAESREPEESGEGGHHVPAEAVESEGQVRAPTVSSPESTA